MAIHQSKNNLSPQNIVMGFQHMFVMFGATVLVPIITGLDISVALFASGVGTLIFHVVTKFKVPVYLGSSFAFIPAILAIKEKQSLSAACGGILIAGLLYIVVAILFQFISFETIHNILPPHVTGPMIILIGLILAPVAIQNSSGVFSPDLVAQIGAGRLLGFSLSDLCNRGVCENLPGALGLQISFGPSGPACLDSGLRYFDCGWDCQF